MPSQLAALFGLVAVCTPQAFQNFAQHLDAAWLEQALRLRASGAKTRKRKLPPWRAIWLVIGMALFRDRSIEEVVSHLELTLDPDDDDSGVAPSAIPQAREPLGWAPMRKLFGLSAESWTADSMEARRWRGLRLWALDGTCFRVPDTQDNVDAFGVPKTGNSVAAYPQVRLVALLDATSHLLRGINFGPFADGELSLARPLWGLVPDYSLILKDRGLLSWWVCHHLTSQGTERHWLMMAKSNLSFRLVKRLGPGDELIEVVISHHVRREHPEVPQTMIVRRVQSARQGYRPRWLLASLLDPAKYPAEELADLYAERWEIELGYDEVKTHMLESEEALRSKKPGGVLQEIYGVALAYNLVRVEMQRVAREQGIDTRRISFRHALLLIRNFLVAAWATSPGAQPRRLGSLDRDLRLLILPERRRGRSFPRQVKVKSSKWPRKPRTEAA